MSVVYPRPGNSSTVYVGGIDQTIDEATLYEAFIPFGTIAEVFIPRDKTVEAHHRGFGFIEYEREANAKAAIDNMHMNQLKGVVVRCNMARPMRIATAGVHSGPAWEMETTSEVVDEGSIFNNQADQDNEIKE